MSSVNWKAQTFLKKRTSLPLAIGIILSFLGTITILFGSNFIEIKRSLTTYGEIVSTEGVSRITSPVSGKVLRIIAQVGEKVKKGQPLLELVSLSQLGIESVFIVRSDIDGLIASLPHRRLEKVNLDSVVAVLIPEQSQFGVKIQIPDYKISLVKAQQRIRIAVDAYSYQKYGQLSGEIVSVDKVSSVSQPNNFFATGQIHLQSDSRSPASEIKLYPGLRATVYIETAKSSLFDFMLEQLIQNN